MLYVGYIYLGLIVVMVYVVFVLWCLMIWCVVLFGLMYCVVVDGFVVLKIDVFVMLFGSVWFDMVVIV